MICLKLVLEFSFGSGWVVKVKKAPKGVLECHCAQTRRLRFASMWGCLAVYEQQQTVVYSYQQSAPSP